MATAPSAQTMARLETWTDKYAVATQDNRSSLLALVFRFWGALTNPYSAVEAAEYRQRVTASTRRAQQRQVDLAIAYQRRALREMSVRPPSVRYQLPAQPRGVDPDEVAERALREFRIEMATLDERLDQELDELDQGDEQDRPRRAEREARRSQLTTEARQHALTRALVMADDDVSLAEREAERAALQAAGDVVIGHRRIIHPELSLGGVCGLCVAAADRVYEKENLRPVHARCRCSSMAVLAGGLDPGDFMNQADLKRLYRLAGEASGRSKPSTAKRDLAKVRFQVDEHGELGPYLRERPRTPQDKLARIDKTIAGLKTKRDAGDDVAAGLKRQGRNKAREIARMRDAD